MSRLYADLNLFANALILSTACSFMHETAAAQNTGNYKRTTYTTQHQSFQMRFAQQRNTRLLPTTCIRLTPPVALPFKTFVRNGLPPTTTDSFVRNAGKLKEMIYGDESTCHSPPPYMSFSEVHRIDSGINGARDHGLTTIHGSNLPSSWGRDEFSRAPEWYQSGARGHAVEGLPLRRELTNKKDRHRRRQFPTGYIDFDKERYYDEDRLRPPSDPYYQYLPF